MIVGIGQLRNSVQELILFRWPLINTGKEIDQVLSWFPCCSEIDDDVTLCVEPAGISHVCVVICCDIDVVVLSPTDSLEMNRYRCSCRPRCWSYAYDRCFNCKVTTRNNVVAVAQFASVTSTEILGDHH